MNWSRKNQDLLIQEKNVICYSEANLFRSMNLYIVIRQHCLAAQSESNNCTARKFVGKSAIKQNDCKPTMREFLAVVLLNSIIS